MGRRRSSVILFCVAAILAISAGSAFADNLITNGTFDNGTISGWTSTGTVGIFHWPDMGIPDSPESGAFVGQVTSWGNGGGNISQDVYLVGNATLSLDVFSAAHTANGPGQPGLIGVFWNGDTLLMYGPPSGTGWAVDSQWVTKSFNVTGEGVNTLTVGWLANWSEWTWTCVDDVRLSTTPEPSSLLALTGGLLSVVGFAIRRRK